ncbi:hypothetical protein I3842_12G000700 [Carya illinoinensis]|uniref:Uncharacterized protein n=1 Tax=Carya illinoinensis TaxID=32201 RepID=A0A922IU93_CARIL|nr:hypothetical protein I3842_12G000700 [Carya illinoinensis]
MGCLEEERIGLLHLKVTYEERWLLNVSLLEPFKELRSLDLSFNAIDGRIRDEEINLETLILDDNWFDDSIIPSLSNLTSLVTLSLAYSFLGYEQVKAVEGFKRLAVLRNLETLNLNYNHFDDSIIPSLSGLTSLTTLSLASNYLNGGVNYGEDQFCALKKLEVLDLSYNYFEGILSTCINNMTSLVVLDISANQFNENASSSYVEASRTSLEYIAFSYNQFVGIFSFNLFANYSKLEVLRLNGQNKKVEIETEDSMGWCPLFQLKIIELSNCSLNKLTGNIPKFLLIQHELDIVDLSHSKLKESFPNWLVENNTKLRMLDLRNNFFVSQLYLPTLTHTHMTWMDVSANHLDGNLPENIGKIFPNLLYLNLSNNILEDNLPSSIGGVFYLEILDFSSNNFSGRNFRYYPPMALEHVTLENSWNKFTGSIPKVPFNSSSLLTLDIGDNNFTGNISIEIKQLQVLRILLLSGNHFTGIIPNQLCLLRLISIMDLSKNAFSDANAPSYVKNVDTEVEIKFVTKYRPSSYKGSILGYMSGLDFSCNNLTGDIPPTLGQISSLHALNLSYNQLTGKILTTFSKLALLESLDLSHNSLSGEIPSALIDLTFLEVFNVVNNNLSGKVPDMKAQFGTFEKSNYEGNLHLCGPPLDKSCAKVNESYPAPRESSKC